MFPSTAISIKDVDARRPGSRPDPVLSLADGDEVGREVVDHGAAGPELDAVDSGGQVRLLLGDRDVGSGPLVLDRLEVRHA